jgi:hypothetical protein
LLQFSKALTEVKTEGTRRQGRRRKQLRGDLKEKIMYWNLKEEALVVLSGEIALEEVMNLSQDISRIKM